MVSSRLYINTARETKASLAFFLFTVMISFRNLFNLLSSILFGFLPRIAIIKLKFVKADLKNEQG